jgi:hypothetical protein
VKILKDERGKIVCMREEEMIVKTGEREGISLV